MDLYHLVPGPTGTNESCRVRRKRRDAHIVSCRSRHSIACAYHRCIGVYHTLSLLYNETVCRGIWGTSWGRAGAGTSAKKVKAVLWSQCAGNLRKMTTILHSFQIRPPEWVRKFVLRTHTSFKGICQSLSRCVCFDFVAFCSKNGAKFYHLPENTGDKLTLKRAAWTVPETCQIGSATVVPLKAGETLQWKLVEWLKFLWWWCFRWGCTAFWDVLISQLRKRIPK